MEQQLCEGTIGSFEAQEAKLLVCVYWLGWN